MRVGEVAARAGVNVETLRYYERRGLLPAAGEGTERASTIRRRDGSLPARDQGRAGGRLHARRDRRVPARARRSALADGGACGCGWRRRSTRSTRGSPACGGCATSSPVSSAARATRSTTARAALRTSRGADATARPAERLHITNGESAANTLRQTALGGAVLPWQDVLHEGPVPALPRVSCCARGRGVPRGLRLGQPAARSSRRSSGATGSSSRRCDGESRSCSGSSTTSTTSSSCSTCSRSPHEPSRARADRRRLLPRQAGVSRSRRADRERARGALARPPDRDGRARSSRPRAPGTRSARRTRRRSPVGAARERRSCRSSRPRWGACSRSCPHRPTGCRGPNGGRFSAIAEGARTPAAAFLAAQDARGGPVPRRRLVLPGARRARARERQARRDRGRRAASRRLLRSATGASSPARVAPDGQGRTDAAAAKSDRVELRWGSTAGSGAPT